jgi:hypothetical protein
MKIETSSKSVATITLTPFDLFAMRYGLVIADPKNNVEIIYDSTKEVKNHLNKVFGTGLYTEYVTGKGMKLKALLTILTTSDVTIVRPEKNYFFEKITTNWAFEKLGERIIKAVGVLDNRLFIELEDEYYDAGRV